MARQREFDPNAVLQAAMMVFWEKGYYDTSIEDLVQQTKVSRYGLYQTFGNKHGLFLASLDYYQQTLIADLLQGMEASDAGIASIEAYFNRLLELAETNQYGRLGCLMANTATELALHNPEVSQKVENQYAQWHNAFLNALGQAQTQGDLAPYLDLKKTADYLVGTLQGTLAMVRSQQPIPAIQNHINLALTLLRYSAGQPARDTE